MCSQVLAGLRPLLPLFIYLIDKNTLSFLLALILHILNVIDATGVKTIIYSRGPDKEMDITLIFWTIEEPVRNTYFLKLDRNRWSFPNFCAH